MFPGGVNDRLGQWFRYLTGGLEVAGALGLLNNHTAAFAAAGLTAVMAGAVLAHVFILGGSGAMPIGLLEWKQAGSGPTN